MYAYATPSMVSRRTVSCGLWTVFLSAALVLPGCGKKKAAEGKEVIPIRAMRVEARTIARSLDYADSIEAQDKAEIFPKVNGKIIEKLKEDGSPVTKGETIAYIDRDEVVRARKAFPLFRDRRPDAYGAISAPTETLHR